MFYVKEKEGKFLYTGTIQFYCIVVLYFKTAGQKAASSLQLCTDTEQAETFPRRSSLSLGLCRRFKPHMDQNKTKKRTRPLTQRGGGGGVLIKSPSWCTQRAYGVKPNDWQLERNVKGRDAVATYCSPKEHTCVRHTYW